MKSNYLLTLTLGLLAVLWAGCVLPTTSYTPTETPVSPSTKPTPPQKSVLLGVKFKGFKLFSAPQVRVSVKPSAPAYKLPLKPGEVENLGDVVRAYGLDREAVDKLLKNGFVAVPSRVVEVDRFYLGVESHPVFITSDAVLYVYHALFQDILMTLEEEYFVSTLNKTVRALVKGAEELYGGYRKPGRVKEAVRRVMAFLSVAAKLLDPSFKVPDPVKRLVENELKLIEEASKTECKSPIFGYEEDYTQYKPRGHYTMSEKLKRYFRAMMWLGRMRFEACNPENPEMALNQTTQALIIVYLLLSTPVPEFGNALSAWESIYLPTSFMVGKSDDLTVYDYLRVAKEVYGEKLTLSDLEDENKLKRFMEEVVKLDKSRIVNVPWWPWERARMAGLRFMGQRYILDGYIHQMLLYPYVRDIPRTMGTGLDVMATLSSNRALTYLRGWMEKSEDYRKNMEKLRAYVNTLTHENWTSTLYMGWLYTLRALLKPAGEGYPTFMRTDAWLDKQLNTALASWAQLRHDTILYAKQPYAAKIALPKPPPDPGYVEPSVEVYLRLKLLVNATLNGLKELGLLAPEEESRLKTLEKILDKLVKISVKELKGEELSEEDARFIRGFGHLLRSVIPRKTRDPRIVADVLIDPNTNRVLEVATGYFDEIFVVYQKPDGRKFIGVGAVMSYYEFTWPQTKRLTDEEWRKMLDEKPPERPVWTKSYLGS